jgi:hypothetical protein
MAKVSNSVSGLLLQVVICVALWFWMQSYLRPLRVEMLDLRATMELAREGPIACTAFDGQQSYRHILAPVRTDAPSDPILGAMHSIGISAIGLVAYRVGPDGVRGEQDDRVAEIAELAGPVMSRTASLEETGGGLALREEEIEARPREAMMLADVAGMVGDGDLKTDFTRSTAMVE